MVTSPIEVSPGVFITLAICAMIAGYLLACCVIVVRRGMDE
jgi:hypothetical protein